MQILQRLRKQRGSITLLGAASIGLSLIAFNQVTEYGNAKLLDRELDNYARDVASVALRSELAITSGMTNKQITGQTVDALLSQVKMYTIADDTNSVNLNRKITFGNLDATGNFVKLASDALNPRGASTPPDFSAVAVQLWSTDSFMGVYTPQGKAIYGLSEDNQNSDAGCYCKNRYAACLDMDLTAPDLTGISAGPAALIADKDSDARKDYCNYGYSEAKVTDLTSTKYPYIEFNDAWIGRPPETVNFFMFYSTSYSGEDFDDILNHKPVVVLEGDDPLKNTSGFASMFSSFFCFFGCSNADLLAKDQSENAFERRDIRPTSSRSDYICEKPGFMFIPTRYPSCDSASSSNDAVLNDSTYIGYQGTCVAGTSTPNVAMSRCLSYNDGATPRYESCLEIERRSSLHMNFFQRMMAFFLGPILNWERSYEGLNCEVKKMKYVGWMFWGGWKDV
jgi:hypothetical protein